MTPEPRYALTFPGLPVTVDLSAEEVRRYLEAMGWAEDTSDVLRGTWRRFRAAWGPVYVPALDGAADFAVRLREAIELIGRAENRPALDVARDIIARRPGAAPSRPAPVGLDLDAIEARAHAATPGPWRPAGPDGDAVAQMGSARRIRSLEDAAFIAAARTDVPALLAEVRRLRASLDAMHRRAQKAEGLIERYEAPQKACKRGSGSLGRAAANYAAAQAERKLEAYRAWAKAWARVQDHDGELDLEDAAEAERVARHALAAADPEHAAVLVEVVRDGAGERGAGVERRAC